MGYRHISNLYRPEAQYIFLLKECYALEKIHGTSAHISFKSQRDPAVVFFPGGEKYDNFKALFNDSLVELFKSCEHEEVTIFGEAYGGKQQGMSANYIAKNHYYE